MDPLLVVKARTSAFPGPFGGTYAELLPQDREKRTWWWLYQKNSDGQVSDGENGHLLHPSHARKHQDIT